MVCHLCIYIISNINYNTDEVTYKDGGYDTISEIERRVKNGETVPTHKGKSFFPILIKLCRTNEHMVITKSVNVPISEAFIVVETNITIN